MTTLDHRFYPHILDLIFETAPRMSLFALRTASHAFHDRADHALAKHLSISIHPAIRGQVPTSTIGDSDSDDSHSENGYQDSRTQILGLDERRRLPAFPNNITTRTARHLKKRQLLILGSARVVDRVGGMSADYLNLLTPSFNLDTYRVMSTSRWEPIASAYLPFTCKTVVLFGSEDPPVGYQTLRDARKLVVRLSSKDQDVGKRLMVLFHLTRTTHGGRIVLICDPDAMDSLLSEFPTCFPFLDTDWHIIIVDFPCDLAHDHQSNPAACAARKLARLRQMIQSNYHGLDFNYTRGMPFTDTQLQTLQNYVSRFSLMSREQYLSTLSPEEAILETVEPTA
ncbi:uncharacterized protein EHS24_002159 [Apiotrichum porosum]|uniref:Uncharacterized protein n=1 Tax=Apiotrichum porosum TaxID=105984 RepID=A0A427XI60_9TREE|nr:uncharacterized protein EHS24_002159 [Apiotrichum porosum]RSH78434.1 hypothetical protein EHS24_002159 [Apiotrichum porosum]